jgi:hypothetical protein
MWTQFMDMHSGGGSKDKWEYIYIEAPEKEAVTIFYNMFDHSPNRVTCTCCGGDYSIYEYETLEQATAYERGCAYAYFNKEGAEIPKDESWISGKGMVEGCYSKYVERRDEKYSYKTYVTIEEYLKKSDIRVIYANEILPEHRVGSVPEQGYVWVD